VVSPENRLTSAWRGAQIVANLTSCTSEWITLEDYEEHGPFLIDSRYPQCLAIDLPDYMRDDCDLVEETLEEKSLTFQT